MITKIVNNKAMIVRIGKIKLLPGDNKITESDLKKHKLDFDRNPALSSYEKSGVISVVRTSETNKEEIKKEVEGNKDLLLSVNFNELKKDEILDLINVHEISNSDLGIDEDIDVKVLTKAKLVSYLNSYVAGKDEGISFGA